MRQPPPQRRGGVFPSSPTQTRPHWPSGAFACMGYKYFALQGGGQCFCGKAFGSSPQHAKAPDGQCGRVCVGEEGKTPPRLCGGGWRNAVYASPLGASETAGWRVGGSTLA